jgi:hypothetical protein
VVDLAEGDDGGLLGRRLDHLLQRLLGRLEFGLEGTHLLLGEMSGQRNDLHLHLRLDALRIEPLAHLPDRRPVGDLTARHG